MQTNSKAVNDGRVEETEALTSERRIFLGRVAAAGLSLAALSVLPAEAATAPKQPEADSGHNYPMRRPNARNEREFRLAFIGPATLSLLTSQIAVDKVTNPAVVDFANFELREQIGASTVLKSLNTPVPPLNATQRATLAKMKSTSRGPQFDSVYMKAQLETHLFLRDLTESYLSNSSGRGMAEMHGRHLATLALGTIKEHVVHCKRFLGVR